MTPDLPEGWTAAPATTELTVASGETAQVAVRVRVPAAAVAGRQVLTVDLELRGRRYGQRAECLVDVAARPAGVEERTDDA